MKKETVLSGLALLVASLALLASLQKTETHRPSDPNADIVALQKDFDSLKTRVNELWIERLFASHKEASFNTTSQGFSLIETQYGNLMVSLKNTEKYGDGYKLTFEIGNPTSLTISGLSGEIEWQPLIDYKRYYDDENYKKETDEKTKSKKFHILSDLYPGAWNVASITIGPASEETIGNITVRDLSSDTIKMRSIAAGR